MVQHSAIDHTGLPGITSGAITQAYVGYNTVGGTMEAVVARRVYMKKVTLANACLLTSVEAYVDGGTLTDQVDSLSGALFADNAGSPREIIAYCNNVGGTLLPDSINGAGGHQNPRWLAIPIGKWLTAGDYWLSVAALEASITGLRIAKDGSGTDRYYASGGDWWADSGFYSVTTTTDRYSIRANTIR